jgi:hypothetical protein
MSHSFLDRLRLKFHRFDPSLAKNPELRSLPRNEALFRVDQKRSELIADYIRGDISGHQCRVFLVDYIRDSIPLADELRIRERHAMNIEVATLEREVAPEEDEIEHAVANIARNFDNDRIDESQARERVERLVRFLADDQKVMWRQFFNSLNSKKRWRHLMKGSSHW